MAEFLMNMHASAALVCSIGSYLCTGITIPYSHNFVVDSCIYHSCFKWITSISRLEMFSVLFGSVAHTMPCTTIRKSFRSKGSKTNRHSFVANASALQWRAAVDALLYNHHIVLNFRQCGKVAEKYVLPW